MTASGEPDGAAGGGGVHFAQRHFCALLALIVLLAVLLRFPGLAHHPPGLFRDEAEKGYNAWAIGTRGGVLNMNIDAVGTPEFLTFKRWPWMLSINGTRTSSIYQYLDAPFVRLGGLTPANTRRLAALMGTLAVLAVGLGGRRIWNPALGLLAALWVAVSPWHIIFSRWALEGSFVPCLLMLALSGCHGVRLGRRWGWPLLGGALGWLFGAYSGAQPFVLAWGFCLALLYVRPAALRRPGFWLGVALFSLPVIPTAFVILKPGGAQRLHQVMIGGEGASPVAVALQMAYNYLLHFSPQFLFLRGDPEVRHSFPQTGTMLWVDAVLLPLGMIWAFRKRTALRWELLLAMVCGPLPAAITKQVPHALRSLPMGLPCVIFSALGLCWGLGAMHAALRRQGKTAVGAGLYPACVLALCVGLGLNAFARYWRAGTGDPGYAQAFQADMARVWPRLATQRKPGERLFYSLAFYYAPYYQLFYERLDPVAVARDGIEASGVVYTDADYPQIVRMARPGDWVLFPRLPIDPEVMQRTGMDVERAARIHEMWDYVEQFTTESLRQKR